MKQMGYKLIKINQERHLVRINSDNEELYCTCPHSTPVVIPIPKQSSLIQGGQQQMEIKAMPRLCTDSCPLFNNDYKDSYLMLHCSGRVIQLSDNEPQFKSTLF
jgi:hypothetical protein